MHTRLLTLAFLGWSCGDDKDDSASGGESDADTDADADTDTDSDTDFFFSASGTFDGDPVDVDCPPDQLVTTRTGKGKNVGVSAICAVAGSYSVSVGVHNPVEGAVTTCDTTHWVLVTSVTGGVYTCMAGSATSFEVDLTEVTSETDATVWGGTFAVTGDDGTHATDLSGSFHVRSVAF